MNTPSFPIWERIDLLCDLVKPRHVVRPSVPEEFLRGRSVINHQAVWLGTRAHMHDNAEAVLLWIGGACGLYGNLWLEQRQWFVNIIKRFYSVNGPDFAYHGDAAWVVPHILPPSPGKPRGRFHAEAAGRADVPAGHLPTAKPESPAFRRYSSGPGVAVAVTGR